MPRISTLLLFLIQATVACALTNADLPPTPAGFTWKLILEDKAAILLPNGWSFSSSDDGEVHYFNISEDELKDTTKQPCFKLAVAPKGSKGLSGQSPIDYARAQARSMLLSDQLTTYKDIHIKNFELVDFDYHYTSKAGTPAYRFVRYYVSDKTSTLWYVSFDFPKSSEIPRLAPVLRTLMNVMVLEEAL